MFVKSSAVFEPHWNKYLLWVIQKHEEATWAPVIVTAPLPPPATLLGIDEDKKYFLPDIIIWDPIKQYPAIGSDLLSVCYEEGCGSSMKVLCWQDGTKSRYNPRCLYGVNGFTVLLCQIFVCPHHHFITSCDPRVLKAFSNKICIPIPFILLHRTGVTREAYSTIFDMACQGTSFSDIEKFILWQYQEKHSISLLNYLSTHEHQKEHVLQLNPCPTRCISNDLVMELFIMMFNTVKPFLHHSMLSLTAEHLSCDHTFKLPKHIGLMRGKNWVTQYDSLFIMQSGKGEILFWQLTSGTAYSAVNDGLQSLGQRIHTAHKTVKMIIIDNCCSWRRKLMNTFGDHVKVKLDIFHAAKRVSGALSKKHTHFHRCIQDWKLVFRSKGDNGQERKYPTPSPETLICNVEHFMEKWSNVNPEGDGCILNSVVIKEIESIKKHMQKGCLSEIPAGFGTNRNENLHRSINHRLAGNHISVELAVALLSVFFHMWNTKRREESYNSISAMFLRSSTAEDMPCIEHHRLGLGVSAERLYCEEQQGSAFTACSGSNEIMRQIERIRNDLTSIEPPPLQSNVSIETILTILTFADSCIQLENAISDLSDTHPMISRINPHLCCTGILKDKVVGVVGDENKENMTRHKNRLGSVLESYQLKAIDVPEDGDCLFTSVAMYIDQLFKSQSVLPQSLINHFQSIGITSIMSKDVLISYLRELLVHEWLLNQDRYQPFFTSTISDFETESLKYLKLGIFSSDIGDAMLLGLSNALRIPIVVFTSVESWPYFTIQPQSIPVDSKPILLAFLQIGPGHYSLATKHQKQAPTSFDKVSEGTEQYKEIYCRCGRGKNANNAERLNCSKSSVYSSRCPCLKKCRPCTSTCACKNCDNPFGKNDHINTRLESKAARRKRPRHKEQDLARSTSVKFMKLSDEQPAAGKWTPMEYYVLLAILQSQSGGKEFTSDLLNHVSKTSAVYSDVVQVVLYYNISISLAAKSSAQINAKIAHCVKEFELLKDCGFVNILP